MAGVNSVAGSPWASRGRKPSNQARNSDAGSISQSTSPFPDFPDDLRYAIGLGLRYALPVGPLRLDYGLNPDRRDGEPSGAFHATFGYAF